MRLVDVGIAWGRACAAQLHIKMLLLTLLPFLVALLIWSVALWLGMQVLLDYVQQWFDVHGQFQTAGEVLGMLGLLAFKAMVVPLVAMWLLLPLMVFTALLCIGTLAMPAISRHVSSRHYPTLEQRRGGSWFGSLWHSLSSFGIFAALWLLSLPLTLIPLLSLIIQPLLWGWLTYRVIVYDALAEHADAAERRLLLREHRWSLLLIGTVAGLFGAAPGLLWLGGVVSMLFLPVFAALAIWLYVLVFVFSGLWFQHYCLAALARLRATAALN
ncbi:MULTISPECIES: EI24 domain-containing protein [unclassified Undibacterium]|uniref:EI24 domain-containing protein n=1 Tax=unclassified Undibacterium TaxID=2630295 RepID=UPI002AC98927|nr:MULTISPECIES: EI24 domain-containing protein [unclassified Undibacterium]MEB0138398.1 EI24 domain-containing protein [Undibacterium sp. CCC2.1]MEB0171273.1 EI24 domain-containing protein [Undibacterium sp. CCC1.1]MEB0176489.1 EI24 domain-containing protein [Undibacterium sp. CCC3.4]MEB0214026.1 EI24 domain-containing protein [Undibacterium sp. 5I2]WPX43642.1 EI24 domain-containing protein [Undibacterium sp. CCC3.4]